MLVNVSYSSTHNFKCKFFKLKKLAKGKKESNNIEPSFSVGGAEKENYHLKIFFYDPIIS